MEIGGDIAGLYELSGTLDAARPKLEDSAEYLSDRVRDLVHDAGWSGDAAQAFEGAWERDAAALVELHAVVGMAADVLGELADRLRAAQSRLDDAVEGAAEQGLTVGPGGAVAGPYPSTLASAAQAYATAVGEAYAAAREARQVAYEELSALLEAVTAGGTRSGSPRACSAPTGWPPSPHCWRPTTRSPPSAPPSCAKLAAFEDEYARVMREKKHARARSQAKRDLIERLKGMRAERKALKVDVAAAEGVERSSRAAGPSAPSWPTCRAWERGEGSPGSSKGSPSWTSPGPGWLRTCRVWRTTRRAGRGPTRSSRTSAPTSPAWLRASQ